MRIIIDAREYDALEPGAPQKYGASEPLVLRIAKVLSDAGHRVDGVWKGIEERFVDGVVWWPWNRHPHKCDVLVSCEWLIHASEFEFKRLYVPLNKINPILDGHEAEVDGFIVFNEEHKRELLLYNNTIKPEQCVILPVGVDPAPELPKVPHRLVWCHTPERGLVHMARQWEGIVKRVPDASIVLTYGLDRSWETNKWLMDTIAEYLAECRIWRDRFPGSVLDRSRLSTEEVRREQALAEIASYPADAPLPGIVTSLALMECAAAGCALLLSNLEGLPVEFGEIAQFLDIPVSEPEWIDATVDLLLDDERKQRMAEAGRAWAAERPWSRHAELWQRLVEEGSLAHA